MSTLVNQPVFDEGLALKSLGGDRPLFLQMVAFFIPYAEELRKPLRLALAAGDALKLRSANHKLMGCVCNFGPCLVYHVSRDLEAAIDGGRHHELPERVRLVDDALDRLLTVFHRLIKPIDLPK